MILLQAEALHYAVEGHSILRGVQASIESRAFIALLGPNGSGKTTLLKALAGIIDIGSVRYGESGLKSLNSTTRADQVLYVGSSLETFFPVKTEEVFQAAGIADLDRIKEILTELECPRILGKEVRTLSAGERQILLLARALLRAPRVLLLDETLSKLDLHHLSLALRLLKRFCQRGGAVVWVSHDWSQSLRHAERAWVLDQGRWAAQGKAAELNWREILAQVFPGANVRAEMQSGSVQFYFD